MTEIKMEVERVLVAQDGTRVTTASMPPGLMARHPIILVVDSLDCYPTKGSAIRIDLSTDQAKLLADRLLALCTLQRWA